MGLALAHALEFPGKLRLDEATYRDVQTIYYPGFTVGGLVGELGSRPPVPVSMFLTPGETERFWWIAAAFAFLASAMPLIGRHRSDECCLAEGYQGIRPVDWVLLHL